MLKTMFYITLLAMYAIPSISQILLDVNFNDDIVGQPPSIAWDGLHPTNIDEQGGPVMVVEQLGDLVDQPLLLRDNNENSSGVYFELSSPVAEGILIFQASLVVDRIIEGMGSPMLTFVGDGVPNSFLRITFGQNGNVYVAGIPESVRSYEGMVANQLRIMLDFNHLFYTVIINGEEVATEIPFNNAYGSTSTELHWFSFNSSEYQTEITGFAIDNIKLIWDKTMDNEVAAWQKFKSID